MNPIIIIAFVGIVGVSLVLILDLIENQQELADIQMEISQIQQQRMQVLAGIAGKIESGKMILKNSLNRPVEIIQIRAYSNGNFVESFPVDGTIPANTSTEFAVPARLQNMMESP